jgi:hypothetical protein
MFFQRRFRSNYAIDEHEFLRTAPPRTPLLEGRNPDVEPGSEEVRDD